LRFLDLIRCNGSLNPHPHRRFTRVRKAVICAALAALLPLAVEAAKPRRTPTPFPVSSTARERPASSQEQPAGPVQSAATPNARPGEASAPASGSYLIPFGLLGLAFVGLLLFLIRHRKIAQAEREQLAVANEAERQSALNEFESLSLWTERKNWPNLNGEVAGVILAESETCVGLSRGVQHMQLRKRTHYEGRSAGVSVRIMKGVSVRSGGFAGRPVTTVSEEVGDLGTVFVTDRRVVFAGAREIVEVPLRKLADVRAEVGRLELLVANKPNPLEFQFSEAYRAPVIAGIAKLMAGVEQAGHSGKP
jgi:hypothetical protein